MSSKGYTGPYELDFERPLIQLEKQIIELETQSAGPPAHGSAETAGLAVGVDLRKEIKKLRDSHTQMLRKIYDSLGPWDTIKVARHPGRLPNWLRIDLVARLGRAAVSGPGGATRPVPTAEWFTCPTTPAPR